jgi:hypothetical protein
MKNNTTRKLAIVVLMLTAVTLVVGEIISSNVGNEYYGHCSVLCYLTWFEFTYSIRLLLGLGVA